MGPARRFFSLPTLLFAALLLLPTLPAWAESIDLKVGFSVDAVQIDVNDSDSSYRIEGARPLQASGAPALPYFAWQLVIPQDRGIASVELLDAKWEQIDAPKSVQLAGGQVSSEGDVVHDTMRGLSAEWKTGAAFPAVPVRSRGVSRLEGYHLGGVEFIPLRVTADGVVELLREGRLHLVLEDKSFEDAAQREVAWPGVAEAASKRVAELVINPEAVAAFAPSPGTPYELLREAIEKTPHPDPGNEIFVGGMIENIIVCRPEYVGEFQRLADDHTAHGVPTKVVTTQWIQDNYAAGADLSETIRNFFKQAYALWGLRYAMIGGDAEVIPTRYARSHWYPTQGFSDIPCDLYFGALDGNWNGNGNGIFGESYQTFLDPGDHQDMVAEIVVGRAPVKSVSGAATFVDKCLAYQNPGGTGHYLGRALFLSEVLFPQVWDGLTTPLLDGALYSEAIISNSLNTPGNLIESVRLYENYTAYPFALQETKQAAMDSMTTGNFGLVNHIGHGFYYNMSVADGNIFTADVRTLNNAPNFFLLYALNCSSGAFDFDCLLETFVQNPGGGSVASLGSSRAAFPTAANEYQQAFYAQIYVDGNVRIGDAMNASRDANIPPALNNENFKRWTHFVYTLLGDPVLRVWRKAPIAAAVSLPSSVPLGTKQISVTVESSGLPVPAAQVTLHKDGEAYATARTDSLTGEVTLDCQALSEGEIQVVVSGSSLEPWFGTITVGPAPQAHVVAIPLSIDDSPGGDGIADAGESFDWLFQFENTGDGSTAPSVSAVLRAVDAVGATITDSTITVGNVNGGQTISPADAFGLTIAPHTPDGTTMIFELESTSGGDVWSQLVELRVLAPEPVVTRVIVDDSNTGNDDGVIQPGETVELFVEIKNYGGGTVDGLVGQIMPATNITIIQGSNDWSSLSLKDAGFGLTAFQVSESDTSIENFFTLSLGDNRGHQWEHSIELREPLPPPLATPNSTFGPTTIALGWEPSEEPHLLGYRVYRSSTSGGPYQEITEDIVIASGYFRDDGLDPLSRYYYLVATVDSSGLESEPSSEVNASTTPGEISNAYPLPTNSTVEGALAVGDLRGDGSLMAVVGANLVYALDWEGQELLDGDFDAQTLGPINIEGSNYTFAGITLANLDGDPYPEIIANHWNNTPSPAVKGTYVFDNDGSILTGWPQNTVSQSWSMASAADLDGDGDMEIVTNTIGGKTYAWHHDGSEVFDGDANGGTNGVFHVRPGEQFTRVGISLYDLDGDGGREILFGSNIRDGNDNFVYGFKSDGSNAPGWPKNLGPGGYSVSGISIADLDQDGIVEILMPCENDSIYAWQPDGSLKSGYPFFFTSNSGDLDGKTPSLAIGNMDADPELEIVGVTVVSRGTASLHVMDPDGSLLPGWPVELASFSRASPVLGDVDGDGVVDIIFGVGAEDKEDILHGYKANGELLDGFPIALSGSPWGTPTLTDFDRDGDADILVAGFDNLLHVYDMPGQYLPSTTPWPTVQGNVQRTGVYRETTATSVEPGNPTPARDRLVLHPNVPNPFNPRTTITYGIPQAGHVELEIYDLAGRHVSTLVSEHVGVGEHHVQWNGKDDTGNQVASGVYLYQVRAGDFVETKRMVLLK